MGIMKKFLWVDDLRDPPDDLPEGLVWDVARSYQEAIDKLQESCYDVISLDHDLGEEKSGYDVLCWIEEKFHFGEKPVKLVYIHTANPEGARRMYLALYNLKERGLYNETS